MLLPDWADCCDYDVDAFVACPACGKFGSAADALDRWTDSEGIVVECRHCGRRSNYEFLDARVVVEVALRVCRVDCPWCGETLAAKPSGESLCACGRPVVVTIREETGAVSVARGEWIAGVHPPLDADR